MPISPIWNWQRTDWPELQGTDTFRITRNGVCKSTV